MFSYLLKIIAVQHFLTVFLVEYDLIYDKIELQYNYVITQRYNRKENCCELPKIDFAENLICFRDLKKTLCMFASVFMIYILRKNGSI